MDNNNWMQQNGNNQMKQHKNMSKLSKMYHIVQLIIAVIMIIGNGNAMASAAVTDTAEEQQVTEVITRQHFPPDFLFGCSTSALQTEGAGDEGGRGPSTWDSLIQDGTGDRDVAVDSYHLYKEDVKLLKTIGVDTYRFSISWSRILPDGTVKGGINQQGIDFYNNLINELVKNGITPFVTLFHFDLPQALQDKYKGFLSRHIVDDFKEYADICFQNFGDRVKHWTTINEPQIYGQFGYLLGLSNTSSTNPLTDPFLATHHIILAHVAAVQLYKHKYQVMQHGEIGISLVTQWFEPYGETKVDKDASQRAFDFLVGWLMEPLAFGDYPFIMKAMVRDDLPEFTEDEKIAVKGSFDFIGVNYYTSRYAASLPLISDRVFNQTDQFQHVNITVDRNGKPIGKLAPGGVPVFYAYPQGLKRVLVSLKKQYKNPKIYVTENGYAGKRNDTFSIEAALQDDARIQSILNHLHAISRAMKQGANVKGYIIWSLMDCMEMGSGYQVRFGLGYTDYFNNLTRIPKKSAHWLNSLLGSSQ